MSGTDLKWIAAVMILFGMMGFGYCMTEEDKEKIVLLEQQERLLHLLQGEIEHFQRSLPEAFESVGAKLKGPYKELLLNVSRRMREWNGEKLESIWLQELEKTEKEYRISPKAQQGLYELIDNLNYGEYTMQISALGYIKQEIVEDIVQKKKRLEKNRKWIMWFCTLIGILCVIVLI